MGPRLLFLQNSSLKYPVSRLDRIFRDTGIEVDYRWASRGSFPESLESYSGIYLSESPHGAYDDIPFIRREHELIREAAAQRIPMLGVCFGSQLLASALCGSDSVFSRPFCEVGYTWLEVAESATEDPVFKGLDRRMRLFVWHNDEVRAESASMLVYAASDLCPNHIWRLHGAPVWGIQGHPEVTPENARAWFEENRKLLEKDGADVDALIRDPEDTAPAGTMLSNFLAVCRDGEDGRPEQPASKAGGAGRER